LELRAWRGRWEEDCGCSTGGRPGWNQKWRKPLREALNLLRDELSQVFEREGEKVFQDVWNARNGYIEVILNRSPEIIKSFFEQYGFKGLDEQGRIKGLKLLECRDMPYRCIRVAGGSLLTWLGWRPFSFFNMEAGLSS